MSRWMRSLCCARGIRPRTSRQVGGWDSGVACRGVTCVTILYVHVHVHAHVHVTCTCTCYTLLSVPGPLLRVFDFTSDVFAIAIGISHRVGFRIQCSRIRQDLSRGTCWKIQRPIWYDWLVTNGLSVCFPFRASRGRGTVEACRGRHELV